MRADDTVCQDHGVIVAGCALPMARTGDARCFCWSRPFALSPPLASCHCPMRWRSCSWHRSSCCWWENIIGAKMSGRAVHGRKAPNDDWGSSIIKAGLRTGVAVCVKLSLRLPRNFSGNLFNGGYDIVENAKHSVGNIMFGTQLCETVLALP